MLSTGLHGSREDHRRRHYGDRFLPNRSSMDLDVAHYLLVDSVKRENNPPFLWNVEYRRRLAHALMLNQNRILSFWNRPYRAPPTLEDEVSEKELKWKPRFFPDPEIRYVPEMVDDHCLNLLDWSSKDALAIAIGNRVVLWDASRKKDRELLSVVEENGPVTSVSWAFRNQHIAVGINNAVVEIWDVNSNKKLRSLKGGHRARVGSLSWCDQLLTTGAKDAMIMDNDLRIKSHIVKIYKGHEQEVCGVKSSDSGRQLASGGDDNLLFIWDRSMASTSLQSRWLHKFVSHVSTVKALAWCPFQRNLLASGGGVGDQCIKFWNTQTGVCLNSFNTGSEVWSLLWSKNEKELLSSHGHMQNQLTLWKYPTMIKIAELLGHTSRVLYMAQSPNGCKVASAAGDETLRLWNVFDPPEVTKPEIERTFVRPFNFHIR